MEISGISNRSMSYQVNQFSASVKTNSTLEGSGKSMELSVLLSQFSAKVSSSSFDNFNKQGSILDEDFLLKLGKPESNSSPLASNQNPESHSLFAEEGYWGVQKTSQRISDFILQGAGDDLDRLKAGREGMLLGFKDAEKAWGGNLPDISYETMEKSLDAIDEKIRELGGSVVDFST